MQKIILAFFAALFMLITVGTVTSANAYTLQAENGKLMPPSGLNLEADGLFNHGLVPNLEADVSYGAFPAITVTGQFIQDGLTNDGNSQTIVKVAFSPLHDTFGYTAYLGYDLGHAQIPMYGLTLWSDLNFLYGYINLEARADSGSEPAALWLTPGANVKLGSKLRISGEVEAKPDNFSLNQLRLGVSYAFNSHLQTKVTYETNLSGTPGQEIKAGIVAGI